MAYGAGDGAGMFDVRPAPDQSISGALYTVSGRDSVVPGEFLIYTNNAQLWMGSAGQKMQQRALLSQLPRWWHVVPRSPALSIGITSARTCLIACSQQPTSGMIGLNETVIPVASSVPLLAYDATGEPKTLSHFSAVPGARIDDFNMGLSALSSGYNSLLSPPGNVPIYFMLRYATSEWTDRLVSDARSYSDSAWLYVDYDIDGVVTRVRLGELDALCASLAPYVICLVVNANVTDFGVWVPTAPLGSARLTGTAYAVDGLVNMPGSANATVLPGLAVGTYGQVSPLSGAAGGAAGAVAASAAGTA